MIHVRFNAWEYSGCEILWAGIVTNLARKLEDEFGKYKVRLCRRYLFKYESAHTDADSKYSKSNSLPFLKCYTCTLRGQVAWLLSLSLASFISWAYVICRFGFRNLTTELVSIFSGGFFAISLTGM